MIEITVDTRSATVTETELLTVGSVGIWAHFTFSEDWENLSRIACFRTGEDNENTTTVQLGTSNLCAVPWERLTVEGEPLFVGAYGMDGNGNIVIPTIWASAGAILPGTEVGSEVIPFSPTQIDYLDRQFAGKQDVETGKGLSTNDYTNAEKTKLAGVETGANKTVVDTSLNANSTNPVQNRAVKNALDSKVNTADVDMVLSATSEHPIANKTVKAAIDDQNSGINTKFADQDAAIAEAEAAHTAKIDEDFAAQNTRINEKFATQDAKIDSDFETIRHMVGTPQGALTPADMTDHDKVYVYTGATGTVLTNGHWYYWNGTAWTDGGVYNSTAFTTDATLTAEGAAADAKATGDAVGDLKSALEKQNVDSTLDYSEWINVGYVNGTRQSEQAYRTKIYDIPDYISSIHLDVISSPYYDVYGFLNENGQTIEYYRESGSEHSYSIDIKVPDETRQFYVCSNETKVGAAIVVGKADNGGVCYEYIIGEVEIAPEEVIKNAYINSNTKEILTSNGYCIFSYNVSKYNRLKIETQKRAYADTFNLYDSELNLIYSRVYCKNDVFAGEIDIENATILRITSTYSARPVVKAVLTPYDKNVCDISGRKIVWYGTSIPASGNVQSGTKAYPDLVGDILHAKVINEAVGTSCVTCKIPSNISEGNPYGFSNHWERVSRCITNTVEEMNWCIEHFDDRNVFTYATVDSLTESDKEFIRSCSYERKLLPYLTKNTQPSLFVFDHGHNDEISDEKEAMYDELSELDGTGLYGRYQGNSWIDRSAISSVKYDVHDVDTVFVSGVIFSWVNLYTLLDENSNIIDTFQNGNAEKRFENIRVDTSQAYYIVISSSADNVDTFVCKKYTWGDPNRNLYTFEGAMGFLLDLIYSYNPYCSVAIIGEYENQKSPMVAKYQQKVAEQWSIPIFKQWEKYGWSQQIISTNHEWSSGIWIESNAINKMTMLQSHLADGTHPSSDNTGETLRYMAKNIAEWMKQIKIL